MIKILTVSTIPILFLFSSCQHPAGNLAKVNANFIENEGLKITLQELDTREIHSIDSVILDKSGKFSFTPRLNETGFWLLKVPSGKILVILLHPGDQVELTGSARDFPDNIIFKGPEEAMWLNDFFHFTRSSEREVDSLEMILAGRQDSSDYYRLVQKLDTSFSRIWERQRLYEMAFINKHPESLASLIVLNYAFGLSTVLSLEEDFEYFSKVDSALMKNYPDNKHVKFHHQRVLEYKRKTSGIK
ncbi:MAG: hypothetical protein WCK84_07005 [Bacteroidota bacterium]